MPDVNAFEEFSQNELCDRTGPIKSRVMTAIALTEKLRDDSTLDLTHHRRGVSSGIYAQNRDAEKAIQRLDLKGVFGEYGRRSNDLEVWGPRLLSVIKSLRPNPQVDDAWQALLDDAQQHFAGLWRKLYSFDPLRPNYGLGSAAAIVADMIDQADAKGTSASFAFALVGAKLEIRLGIKLDAAPVNSPDRSPRGREDDKPSDFPIGDAAFEITLGKPDKKHLDQIQRIVREWKKEAWLLVRTADVPAWTQKIASQLDRDAAMVVVLSVEGFIGQNMAERGNFSRPSTQDELRALFAHYNDRWTVAAYAPTILLTA